MNLFESFCYIYKKHIIIYINSKLIILKYCISSAFSVIKTLDIKLCISNTD